MKIGKLPEQVLVRSVLKQAKHRREEDRDRGQEDSERSRVRKCFVSRSSRTI